MDFSPDTLRKRFKKLSSEFEPKAEKRDAIRRERDEYVEKGTVSLKKLADYDERIIAANEGLYELEMERAAIARALGQRGLIEPTEG